MATNIVNSLFGTDPALLAETRAKMDADRAFQFANLTPMEQSQYGFYTGGAALGRAVPTLMGGQDPMIAKASMAKQLASQFDITSEEGLRQYAQALAQNGAPDLAQLAVQRADEMLTTGLKQSELQSKTAKNIASATAEKIKPIGLSVDGQQVYQSGDDQYVLGPGGQRIPYFGPLESRTPKQTINMPGAKNVLEVDKKDAEELTKVRNAVEKSIPLLESSLASLDRGIIGGAFSNARTAFNTALASAGLSPIKNIDLLANTKTFNANRIALASSIAKQLGVNPTDRDFQASLDRFAAASEDPRASKIFLTELLGLQKQQLADANAGLDYFRQNQGSFAGYNRPLPRAFSTGPDLSNMSTEQLRQEITKRKNSQKQ